MRAWRELGHQGRSQQYLGTQLTGNHVELGFVCSKYAAIQAGVGNQSSLNSASQFFSSDSLGKIFFNYQGITEFATFYLIRPIGDICLGLAVPFFPFGKQRVSQLTVIPVINNLSLIHISEPTRLGMIS